jgi:hypothetical protein
MVCRTGLANHLRAMTTGHFASAKERP